MNSANPEPFYSQRSGAYFTNSYILDPGVIIADNNYAVVPALNDNFPGWEKIFTTTHIQRVSPGTKSNTDNICMTDFKSQWSDAAWMQWVSWPRFLWINSLASLELANLHTWTPIDENM